MTKSASRERILSKLQKALANHSTEIPYPEISDTEFSFFEKSEHSLAESYAIALNEQGGRFVYCENNDDMMMKLLMLADNLNWKNFLVRDVQLLSMFKENNFQFINDNIDVKQCAGSITLCERLIARSGAAVYSSAQNYGRQLPTFAPIHITIAYAEQLVWDWKEAMLQMQEKYNGILPTMITTSAGPSQSLAIENMPIVGAHGPKEYYTFLIEKSN